MNTTPHTPDTSVPPLGPEVEAALDSLLLTARYIADFPLEGCEDNAKRFLSATDKESRIRWAGCVRSNCLDILDEAERLFKFARNFYQVVCSAEGEGNPRR